MKLVELTKKVKRIQVMSLGASKSRSEKAVQNLVKTLFKNLDEEFSERMPEGFLALRKALLEEG